MKRLVTITIGLTAILCLLLVREAVLSMPAAGVTVHFFDVGQGDSAFIRGPSGEQIVIDGGPDLSLLQHLGDVMPFFDRSIDVLVLSHPNLDHLFAFPELLQRYHIKHVLITGVAFPEQSYQQFLTLLASQKIPVIQADPKKDIIFSDGMMLDVVWPKADLLGKTVSYDVNNTSVVLRVLYGKQGVLFTGDMEEPEEQAVLQSGADIRATILKVAHHGSKTSSGTGWLLAIRPQTAVISVGTDNPYGHPNKEILERLRNMGVTTYLTSQSGSITMTLDGK